MPVPHEPAARRTATLAAAAALTVVLAQGIVVGQTIGAPAAGAAPVAAARSSHPAQVRVSAVRHVTLAKYTERTKHHPRLRVPSPPRWVHVISKTNKTVTVGWHKPRRRGGGPLHRYRIITIDSAGHHRAKSVGPLVHHTTITGLKSTHRYVIRVRSSNAAHRSKPAQVKVLTTTPPIKAQSTPAPVSSSHYLRRLTGSAVQDTKLMRAIGAADAVRNLGGHRYLVLLDIGAQTNGGVVLSATVTRITYGALVRALDAYVSGYVSAQRYNAPALIALGTNNDGLVSRGQGAVWARYVVSPVAAWARSHATRIGRSITVGGANDIEPGFSASPWATKTWLAGFLAAGHATFVFNGSADGCPTTSRSSRCNNGWTTPTLHWLAGGASRGRIIALPQIYNTVMPWQWQTISKVYHQRLVFGGPLTEHYACAQARTCGSITGTSAWRLLFAALRTDPYTRVGALSYSPDLRIS